MVQEWIDIIRSGENTKEIISHWENFNKDAWTWKERMPVTKAYVDHLSNIHGKEHRKDILANKSAYLKNYVEQVQQARNWLDSHGKIRKGL